MVDKAPDAFRTISEVADDLDLPQHVLRFWETRFQQIKPLKRGGGRRYYRPDDIALLRGIQHLLYGEGYTIRGAQRILKDHGVKFVQNVWRPGADQPARAGGAAEPETAAEPRAGASAARTGTARGGGLRASAPVRLAALVPLQRHRRGAPRGKPRRRHGGPSDHAVAGDHDPACRERRQPAAGQAAKLQDTLRDLQECRKLLDAALTVPEA